ncbi:MAG TPA: MarR family transcriptional regulator [Longimicrobium sp.]|nr:MarR family transcriptional regulator [Longimicrobium sp.]
MALQFLSPLHKATRQLSVYLEALPGEHRLSPPEGHLLTYLHSYAPAPIGELVRVFGIKQSTFTSMLDRLENAGFIRREMNPDDRRSFLIHITEAGRARAQQANHVLLELEDAIRSRVSARDVEGFQAVMRAVEETTQVRLRER